MSADAAAPPVPPQCAAAEQLENVLGDPRDPASVMSFRRAVELDGREEFPADAVALLNRHAFYENYVPSSLGGAWRNTDQITLLMRMVARRDLTVAIGHGKTFLGCIAVWLDGSPAQQEALHSILREGGAVSLALTERAHGSDLAASDVTVRTRGGEVVLSGEKWLINNATRGRALSVLARVGDAEPPQPLSMVFVDKQLLPPGSFEPLPKNLTHGIKGADISGIAFSNAVLPASSIIGKPGRGFKTVLRLLQVTRIGCCPLSLGAGDTALRATLDFALSRELYGKTMFDLPHARHLITSSFVDLLIAEAVSTAAARTLHVLPGQLGVVSAVAKYFVPTTVEHLIRELSVALGARFYLRSGHWDGIFEKIVRDHALVPLFDGSTVVNLDVLGSQLSALVDARKRAPVDAAALRTLFDQWAPLPELALKKLSLMSGGRNDVVTALPSAAEEIESAGGGAMHAAVCQLLRGLVAELQNHEADVRARGSERAERFKSPRFFELTKRYCSLYAASACAQLWLHNRNAPDGLVRHPEWLVVALARLLQTLRPADAVAVPDAAVAAVETEMLRMHRDGWLFSLLPVRLAR